MNQDTEILASEEALMLSALGLRGNFRFASGNLGGEGHNMKGTLNHAPDGFMPAIWRTQTYLRAESVGGERTRVGVRDLRGLHELRPRRVDRYPERGRGSG